MSFRLIRTVVYIILFAVIVLVFMPSVENEFVDWDDYAFVSENPHLSAISWESLYWMATTFYMDAWHPLTWFSHALDIVLWGMNPSPHRLVNILIHGFNVLLFCTLAMQLQDVWGERNHGGGTLSPEIKLIAAVTAALLFGVHPLRVESVVWISERKDVLSACFFLASLIAYLAYARPGGSGKRRAFYLLSLGFHLLAVLAKPMAITVPPVLLLLDYYPLDRLDRAHLWNCIREKIPSFLVSAWCVGMNMAATWHGSVPLSYVSPEMRMMNAFHSVVFYIRQSILPANLLPFYQMDRGLDYFSHEFVLSAVIVLGISALCVWRAIRGSRIWLTVWGFFLITLGPASGLFMSYRHAMADRYTYVPTMAFWLLLGLGISRVWQKCADVRLTAVTRAALIVCVILLAGFYGATTRDQMKIWKNTESLWTHLLNNSEYVPDLAYFAMGKILESKDNLDEAIRYYETAYSLAPENTRFSGRLAIALVKKGNEDRGLALSREVVDKQPNNPVAHLNLGRVFMELKRYDEAVTCFQKSLEVSPGYPYGVAMLVASYLKMERQDEAQELYRKYKLKGVVLPKLDLDIRSNAP